MILKGRIIKQLKSLGKEHRYNKSMPTNKSAHRHGGPYDRGSADKFYKRTATPHYFTGATLKSLRIEEDNMTPQQVINYHLGYDNAEAHGSDETNTVYLNGHKD